MVYKLTQPECPRCYVYEKEILRSLSIKIFERMPNLIVLACSKPSISICAPTMGQHFHNFFASFQKSDSYPSV